MPLHWRYLGLLILLTLGWVGAKAMSPVAPEPPVPTPVPLGLTLRKSVALPPTSPALTSLQNAQLLAQLPHPPAAFVQQARVTEVLVPVPTPMANHYESLLERPSSRPHPAPPRLHRIIEGDTLPQIAERYLGSPTRDREIFELNRDRLTDPNILPLGVDLRLPPQPDVADAASVR